MAGFPNYSSTPVQNLVGVVSDPGAGSSLPTSQITNLSLGLDGGLLTRPLGGDYAQMARNGHVFGAALTTAAGTIAVNTTTSGCTWAFVNPVGSGVVAEPIDFELDQLAAGPATQNIVGFSLVQISQNAISGITKAPVPTGGLTTASVGAYCLRLDKPAGACYVATVITFASALTVAANWGYPMFTFGVSYLTTAAVQEVPLRHLFRGKLIVPPGFVLALGASTAWSSNTVSPAMSWAEYPA